MVRKLTCYSVTLMAYALVGGLTQAAFQEMSGGARAQGMSEVFVAVADDLNALHYNPAGLAAIPSLMVSLDYRDLNTEVDDGTELGTSAVALAQPLNRGRGGVAALGVQQYQASGLANERVIQAGYARSKQRLSLGASLKSLRRTYESNSYTENALDGSGVATGRRDPIFDRNGTSQSAFSADAGALIRFGSQHRWTGGVSASNLNRPTVSLEGSEKLPLILRAGISHRREGRILSFEARRARRLASETDTEWAMGAEQRLGLSGSASLAFRAGAAVGPREYKSAAAGCSFRIGWFDLDYAFLFPMGNRGEVGGSHVAGLTFRFSGPRPKTLTEKRDVFEVFQNQTRAAHYYVSRYARDENISSWEEAVLLQMVLQKKSADGEERAEVNQRLVALWSPKDPLLDISSLKQELGKDLPPADRVFLGKSVDYYLAGQPTYARDFLWALSSEARRHPSVRGLGVLIEADLAFRKFQDEARGLENKNLVSNITW